MSKHEFKDFDLLGKEIVKFQINGESNKKTWFGALLTLLLLFTLIPLCWYFGKDLFERIDPKYLSQINQLDAAPLVDMKDNPYIGDFGVQISFQEIKH